MQKESYKDLRAGASIPEKLVDSKGIFRGRILNLRVDEVELPDGKRSIREVIEHCGAVVVIPVLENGNILLVRQYRHASGEFLLELPAGKLDHEKEELEDCARRELLEETHYSCEKMERLFDFFSSPGMTNELMHVFVATGLKPQKSDYCDYDEFIAIADYPVVEALEMVRDGRIRDAKTAAGILYYQVFILKKKF